MVKTVTCPACRKRTSWSDGSDNGPCDHCSVWISLPPNYPHHKRKQEGN